MSGVKMSRVQMSDSLQVISVFIFEIVRHGFYLYLPRRHFCKVDIACLHFIKVPSMLKNSSYI